MNILGVESVVFGVKDVPVAEQFLHDFGLEQTQACPGGSTWCMLDGTSIVVKAADDPSLPPSDVPAPCPRECIWGVSTQIDLDGLAEALGRHGEVWRGTDGTVYTRDPAGLAVGFRVSKRRAYDTQVMGRNVPGQTPGRAVNVVAAEFAEAPVRLRTIAHIVFFVPDLAAAEAFYLGVLGFRATDRLVEGTFMRCKLNHDHHTQFLIEAPADKMRGMHHIAFYLGDIDEVIQAGQAFVRKGAQPAFGPGRHLQGSNYFWYFESPLGGQFEYTSDMDVHDDDWAPREGGRLTLGSSAIWVAMGGTTHTKYLPGAAAGFLDGA